MSSDIRVFEPSQNSVISQLPKPQTTSKPLSDIAARFKRQFLNYHSRVQNEYLESKKAQQTPLPQFKDGVFASKLRRLKGVVRFLTVMRATITQKRLLGFSANFERLNCHRLSTAKFERICRQIAGEKPLSEKFSHPRTRGIIYEDSVLGLPLSLFHLVLLAYIIIYFPFKMAFLGHASYEKVDLAFDCLTLLNVVLNFFRAFTDKVTLVDDFRSIAYRYLTTFLATDLLSLFPFLLFDYGLTGHAKENLCSALKLVKLLRIAKLGSELPTNRIVMGVKQIVKINKRIQQIVSFCLFVVFLFHLLACFVTYVTTLESPVENLLTRGQLIDFPYSPVGTYLVSFYFMVTLFCTVGFGDIVPVTVFEKALCCVLIFIGMSFYAYTLGTLSSILSESNVNLSIVSHRFTFLNSFANEKPINPKLLERITVNLEYFEEIEEVDNSEVSNNFLRSIALDLTYEIAKHIHKDLIRKIVFFQQKDINFISQLIPFLKPRKYQPKELIYEVGEYPTFVYFLLEGRVQFSNTLGKVFKVYTDGSYLGEIEVLKSCLRQFTVRAETDVEVLTLPQEVFVQQIESYPEIKNEILYIAMRRDMINKRSMLTACKLHYMNYSGRQSAGEQSTYDLLKKRCQKNVAQFKERTMQLTSNISLDSVEGYYLRRQNFDGETESEKNKRIMELEHQTELQKSGINPFLIGRNHNFGFVEVFKKIEFESQQTRKRLAHLQDLLARNLGRVKRRKLKAEQGVQAFEDHAGFGNGRIDADLSAFQPMLRKSLKAKYFSHESLRNLNSRADNHLREEGRSQFNKPGSAMLDGCKVIEERVEDDSANDDSVEQVSVSFEEPLAHLPVFDLTQHDQFAPKEAVMRRILLHRRDLLKRTNRNKAESLSSQNSAKQE